MISSCPLTLTPSPHHLFLLTPPIYTAGSNALTKPLRKSYANGTTRNIFFPIPPYFCIYMINPHIGKPNKKGGRMRNSSSQHRMLCLRWKKTQVYLSAPKRSGSIKPSCCTCVHVWNCFTQGKIHEITCRKMQGQGISLRVKHSKERWLLSVRQEARKKWFFLPSMTS